MTEWTWVDPAIAEALHARQLSEHGGAAGTRDGSALESAMARPRNLAIYGQPDAADLAAAYAFGVARNHPFVDGNKRTAWVAARLFLALNDVAIQFDPADAVYAMLDLAGGRISENEMANWFRERIVS